MPDYEYDPEVEEIDIDAKEIRTAKPANLPRTDENGAQDDEVDPETVEETPSTTVTPPDDQEATRA